MHQRAATTQRARPPPHRPTCTTRGERSTTTTPSFPTPTSTDGIMGGMARTHRPGSAPGEGTVAAGPPLWRAVLFDLDDTLVPQAVWLDGALRATAARAIELDPSLSADRLLQALRDQAAAGSARGGVIDRALAEVGATVPVRPLVDAFLAYRAPRLDPFPGVPAMLAELAGVVHLAVVTDGNPAVQRAKLAAADLTDPFDVVVVTDALGRHHRKPDPLAFTTALEHLRIPPAQAVFVGDRPDTDIVGAARLGMATIRVLTGEHASAPDLVPATATVPDAVAAGRYIVERLAEHPAEASPSPSPTPSVTGAAGGPGSITPVGRSRPPAIQTTTEPEVAR